MQMTKDRKINLTVPVNLKKRIEYVGGKLQITNEQLHFKPHSFNIQSENVVIPMEKIIRATKTMILGVSPNGISIELDNHTTYKFVIGAPWSDKREEVISCIQSLIQN